MKITDMVRLVVVLRGNGFVAGDCPFKMAHDFMQGWYHARDVVSGRNKTCGHTDCLEKSKVYLSNGTFSLNIAAEDDEGNRYVASSLMVAVEEVVGIYIHSVLPSQERTDQESDVGDGE